MGIVVTNHNKMGNGNGAGTYQSGSEEVRVTYVKVALVKEDAEVPKLVLDRSESLLALPVHSKASVISASIHNAAQDIRTPLR
jgi:hypothetical protein